MYERAKGGGAPVKAAGRAAGAGGSVYPEVAVVAAQGKTALTAAAARELLGWAAEGEGEDYGTDYLLKDHDGKKVRCLNNLHNRPFYPRVAATYRQDMLRGRWRLNGEPVIVGRTARVLDGQHTLIALVLADQEAAASPARWGEAWPRGVTIEKIIVYGIDESDEVVNTINTGKPRSLTDVIYRSPYFATLAPRSRKLASRCLDHAVKMMWSRTGAFLDPYAPRRTHGEALDFLERHGRLVECAAHVLAEEGTTQAVSTYVPLGYATALMYLMANSATDADAYYKGEATRHEESLDFSRWDQAAEFLVLLPRSEELKELRYAIAGRVDAETGDGAARLTERVALVLAAWRAYAAGEPVTADRLKLEYRPDGDGVFHLVHAPTAGGIDRGDAPRDEPPTPPVTRPAPKVAPADKAPAPPVPRRPKGQMQPAPTPDEIAERARAERARRASAVDDNLKKLGLL